jgi:catechol 2,3-dioxygenase-like lactoylglutathione lyase family enzyme
MSFAHLTLATRDVEKTSAFFEKTLGWRPILRPGNIGRDAAWLTISPGQELHLLRVDDFEPSPFEREFGRHLAVEYPVEDFPALRDRLIESGGELIDPIRETPFARFFFRDPNGYVFEVVDADRQVETS